MESVGLKVEDVLNRAKWKKEIYPKLFRRPQMMGKDRRRITEKLFSFGRKTKNIAIINYIEHGDTREVSLTCTQSEAHLLATSAAIALAIEAE